MVEGHARVYARLSPRPNPAKGLVILDLSQHLSVQLVFHSQLHPHIRDEPFLGPGNNLRLCTERPKQGQVRIQLQLTNLLINVKGVRRFPVATGPALPNTLRPHDLGRGEVVIVRSIAVRLVVHHHARNFQ